VVFHKYAGQHAKHGVLRGFWMIERADLNVSYVIIQTGVFVKRRMGRPFLAFSRLRPAAILIRAAENSLDIFLLTVTMHGFCEMNPLVN
jgi:hypothetical protein